MSVPSATPTPYHPLIEEGTKILFQSTKHTLFRTKATFTGHFDVWDWIQTCAKDDDVRIPMWWVPEHKKWIHSAVFDASEYHFLREGNNDPQGRLLAVACVRYNDPADRPFPPAVTVFRMVPHRQAYHRYLSALTSSSWRPLLRKIMFAVPARWDEWFGSVLKAQGFQLQRYDLMLSAYPYCLFYFFEFPCSTD